MSNPITCDLERIEQFLGEGLSEAEQSAFETHLDDCGDCRRRLEEAAAGADVWTGVRESLSNEPDSWELCTTTAFDSSASEECGVSHEAVLRMLSPTDDERMLGRLGTYEVVGVVGSGGMGVVLKAYDAALNRYVAIKVLAPHLGSSGAARKRFSREAQAAAAVVHENVIEIHGVSDAEGLPYLVMPYLRGPSLQRRLDEEGPLETAEILRIGTQAAAGLAAAHAQGLVHRDVKPANILLADGVERVKLTDFGLARAADDASLTKSGIIAGTPQYMSPEQARGESVDQRSDLFSLGSVLYAMCTGRAPFRAETSYGVLRRITDEEPRPIREINPEIPAWLCQIVGRLMSKEPGDRYESAEEVAELLEACLAHVQQPTVVPLPESLVVPSGGRGFFAFTRRWLGLLATCGIGVLGMLLWQATAPPDISGTWTSEEWGDVLLEPTEAGRYAGTYTNTLHKVSDDKQVPFHLFKSHDCLDCHTETVLGHRSESDDDCTREFLQGKIELKWSRVERRYNGTWSTGDKSGGRMSLRLVGGEIRGGWTTSKKSELKGETPRLSDLLWVRANKAADVIGDHEEFTTLVDRFDKAIKQRRYVLAVAIARKAQEAAPDEAAADTMKLKSRFAKQLINVAGEGVQELELLELLQYPIHRITDPKRPHVVFPPDPIEVVRTLERYLQVGENRLTKLFEAHENNFRIIIEPVYDCVDPSRLIEGIGRVNLHRVRFKCTVMFKPSEGVNWPVPGQANGNVTEDVRIDADHILVHEETGSDTSDEVESSAVPSPVTAADKAVGSESEQDDSPEIVLDKTKLPRVAENYQHPTRVIGDLIGGGGIIERIETGTIFLRSGDRIRVQPQTVVNLSKEDGGPAEFPARLLGPGMAVSYMLRGGKLEKLMLKGIVEKRPEGSAALASIKKLGLWKLGEINDSLDTQFAIRVTGRDGEVKINAGETKLVPLAKVVTRLQWQCGNYKPEEIEDIEPFDYVLVKWHKNGRITWTCYTSVKKPAADEDRDGAAAKTLTPVEKLIAEMQGEWVVETMMDGDSDNLEKCTDRQCELTVDGKVLTYRYQRSYGDRASAMLSMSLKWKDDSVPQEVEITVDPNGINREMPGIIKCDGKVLKFCISGGLPDGARPRVMAPGEKVLYSVCRRKNNGNGALELQAAEAFDKRGAGDSSTVAATTTSVEKLIAEMQGEWIAETMKWGADDSLAEMVDRRCEVSVKKKLLTLRFLPTDAPKSVQSSSMGLEWSNESDPKAVDVVTDPNGDETQLPGIVECDGRVLRICVGLDPDNSKRPRFMIAGEEVLFLECRRNSGEAAKHPGQSSDRAAAVGKTAAELTAPSQDRESNERPTRPIFRGRNAKTGEVELNPAWADPVRRMLARAAVIEVTGDGEKISCEIPGAARGEKAARLLGAVVMLVADGSVGWKTSDQRIFLIRVNRQRVKVAESLLPAVLYALAHPESIKSSNEEKTKLPEGDPRALRADAKRIRKTLLENLLSPLCFLYEPAGEIWELTMSMEEEADLRIRAQELADEAVERQSEGKLKEAKSLKNESERLIVSADSVVTQRKVQQELRNREEQARDDAKQLAARILALKEEGRTSEAAELQLTLNAQLRHMDPDRFRLFDLGQRIVDARTRGRYQEADQLEAERDVLRKTLAERYPGTDEAAASAGDAEPEGGAAISPAAGVVERLAVTRTKEGVRTIACSHDGKLIAVANGSPTLILQADGGSRVKGDWRPSVQILDAISGKVVSELVVTTDEEKGVTDATKWVSHVEVTALAFSSKVNVVAVGTSIGQVKVFDALTGQLYQTLDDERARLGDADTPETWKTLKRGLGCVRSLAFSPDGHLLAACGDTFAEFSNIFDGIENRGRAGTGPGRLKVWDMPAGTLRHDLAGHSHANAVAFSPDGKRLASVGRWSDAQRDGSGVIVWDPKSGKKLIQNSIANNDNGGTLAIAFSPDNRLVAIGSLNFDKDNAKDGRTTAVSLVHVGTGIVEWRRTFSGWAKLGGFSPDGQNVAVLSGGKRVQFLDAETGSTTAMVPFTGENAFWSDIAVSAAGGRLVMGGRTAGQSGGVVGVFGFGGDDSAP